MAYVEEHESIAERTAGRTEDMLAAVANRYIGANPKLPPVYRVIHKGGFRRDAEYRYEMNLAEKLGELEGGQFVYAWAKLWAEQEGEQPLRISCYGPVRVFVNDAWVFQSNQRDDVLPEQTAEFNAPLRRGWNQVVLEFTSAATGCGGRFGTGLIKAAPLHFLAPTKEREGQEGWVYSEPQAARWYGVKPAEAELSGAEPMGAPGSEPFRIGSLAQEISSPVRWLPERTWDAEAEQRGRFARVLGETGHGKLAFAWAKLDNRGAAPGEVTLKGRCTGRCALYLGGRLVYETPAEGGGSAAAIAVALQVPVGAHDFVIRSEGGGEGAAAWGFEFEPFEVDVQGGAEEVRWVQPYPVRGMEEPWLYLGPFRRGTEPSIEDVPTMETLFGEGEERVYWRVDQPDGWVRPYLENPLFGRWNYPLGVTLYGILETGRELGRADYIDYAADHIGQCTRVGEYSLWDAQQYGGPGTNHQLALIDSLDDCGSFGATLLRILRERELPGGRWAADRIAEYISREQDRLPSGMLYRRRGHSQLMHGTVWCDDLYMSTPFLCRYYELTGDEAYLTDAANQFLQYKELLFMPERRIMHHVYNLRFGKPNTVAWGRGNGWVLFSLTELLETMPEGHPKRPEILGFYRELCSGYLALQDEDGLWHQVLTDPQSYPEASCTSMFIYAFSRGVRFGWLQDPAPYVQAVRRGFDGLTRTCIDKHGNVYGVCRGSGYSYSALYYKERLSWLLNDTHGIGIVLLAGIETLRLRSYLAQDAAAGRRSKQALA
ncbi:MULTISPECIES: glycoside hydrolase family 88/105 protein [Paenibacillus]|uniref:glycoside hydrolase family 88/105 protein n=1 Tax=Paenibacillus TaxID=44249 RepID=UPI0022B8FFCB|nr:glycoside hydrolase family 88 protein [Paenibacillus caseinilyticus]MCZ8522428.1 glycoside hydrolase family 88 protein [Paenibacillus caseinilyticus]